MKNKPRIRFKGFTEDWEQRKLSDITEVIMGQSPSSRNYTDNPNDSILVQGNADLKNGKVVPRLWTKEITKTIDKDGIILTVRAPVGDVAKTDYKVVLGRGVAGIKGNDYIYQFLQKLQNDRYWVSLSSGSTFESINSNDIKDLIINIPSKEEQTKISTLLNNVNFIITLHQSKLEKLKLAKKALLQKLFPKNGSQFPEIRFKDFTDAWEQRKLGDLIFLNGRIGFRGYTEADIVSKDEGGVLTFSPTNIVDNQITIKCKNTYITRLKYDESPEIKIYNGDILFVKTGSTLGKSALVKDIFEDATLNPQVVVMRPNNLDSEFLSVMMLTDNIASQVRKSRIGGAVPTLTESNIKAFDTLIPKNDEEAQKIGKIFGSLDHVITLHQRKLDKLQEVKKGLLQKMFV